jgi:hypothetical protein
VAEARKVADEDLIRAEGVAVRAAARRVGDPLPVRGLHKVSQHAHDAIRGGRPLHLCDPAMHLAAVETDFQAL